MDPWDHNGAWNHNETAMGNRNTQEPADHKGAQDHKGTWLRDNKGAQGQQGGPWTTRGLGTLMGP